MDTDPGRTALLTCLRLDESGPKRPSYCWGNRSQLAQTSRKTSRLAQRLTATPWQLVPEHRHAPHGRTADRTDRSSLTQPPCPTRSAASPCPRSWTRALVSFWESLQVAWKSFTDVMPLDIAASMRVSRDVTGIRLEGGLTNRSCPARLKLWSSADCWCWSPSPDSSQIHSTAMAPG